MYVPNLTRFQHSHLEKCGFLAREVNECCTRCTENTQITKIDFHREKWCGNKCTKFERKTQYRREDVLFSTTCNFYSDKIITPQARFCWTLPILYVFMNQIIQQITTIRIAGFMHYNLMLETVFWDVLADFIHTHRYFFFIVPACMEIKAKRCCICFDPSH